MLRSLFPRHAGREIETTGDGFLVEFASAPEATRRAIAIQKAIAEHNVSAASQRRFAVRIGIHAKLLEDGADRTGDGLIGMKDHLPFAFTPEESDGQTASSDGEEPGAEKPPAGIGAGGAGQPASLSRSRRVAESGAAKFSLANRLEQVDSFIHC